MTECVTACRCPATVITPPATSREYVMSGLAEIIARLDEINHAISEYDPVLKQSACDILLARAFPTQNRIAEEATVEPEASARPRKRRARTSFASMLTRWAPSRSREQALLAVYFLTRGPGAAGATTRAVTTLLGENGIRLPTPTTALLANTTRTPALLSATKSGESKQARQSFQVTPAGEAYIQRYLGEDRGSRSL